LNNNEQLYFLLTNINKDSETQCQMYLMVSQLVG